MSDAAAAAAWDGNWLAAPPNTSAAPGCIVGGACSDIVTACASLPAVVPTIPDCTHTRQLRHHATRSCFRPQSCMQVWDMTHGACVQSLESAHSSAILDMLAWEVGPQAHVLTVKPVASRPCCWVCLPTEGVRPCSRGRWLREQHVSGQPADACVSRTFTIRACVAVFPIPGCVFPRVSFKAEPALQCCRGT